MLANAKFAFRDTRLAALLLRYRARNWPDSLLPSEQAQWDSYRRHRLLTDAGQSELTLAQLFAQITELRATHVGDGSKQVLLDQLEDWGQQRARELE